MLLNASECAQDPLLAEEIKPIAPPARGIPRSPSRSPSPNRDGAQEQEPNDDDEAPTNGRGTTAQPGGDDAPPPAAAAAVGGGGGAALAQQGGGYATEASVAA
eukprot:COSAG05_NODE_1444_length_4871_cov_14.212070_5_plen_103_part_00